MKRQITFLLVAMFVAFGLNAQTFSSVKFTTEPLPQKTDIDVHYDGEPYSGIGVNGPATFEVAARFTSTELSAYYNSYSITKVKFSTVLSASDGTPWTVSARVRIYGNGTATEPGTMLVDLPAGTLVEGWNEFILPTPLALTSGDYWVGYEVTTDAGFPAGCDAGPMVAGKGGWLYFEGDGWFEMSDAGLDYNWNIRATVTNTVGIETEIGQAMNVFGGNGIITINNADATSAQVYNVIGQLVNTADLSSSHATIQVPAGIYIVRVGDTARKVFVR